MPSNDSGAFDLIRIFDALESVAYIVIGGVAATLHGSPRLTFDLEIVPDRSGENVSRLAQGLVSLEATLRQPRGGEVTARLLQESANSTVGGQLRLRTRYGPVDVIWRLHDGRGFDELAPLTVTLSDRERTLSVIDIEPLIEIKRVVGRRQDTQDVENLEIVLARRKDR